MLSSKIRQISPSATLTITSLANEYKEKGYRVIAFAAGQLDFPTPKNICEAAKKAIDEGFTRYTPSSGIPELKEAVAKKLKKENHLDYSPSQIIITAGGKQALFNLIFSLTEKDDEVILPVPAWVSYIEQIKLSGAKPVLIPTKKNFKITAEQLEEKISKRTKLFILNSPANPTGAVYEKNELEALAKILVKHKIFVISDEVYEKCVFDGLKHISIASLNEKIYKLTFVVNAVSKTYSMTGWRIGYAAGDEKAIAACSALQSHTTSNPCSISQKAALAALTGPQSETKKFIKELDKRRKYFIKELEKIKKIKVVKPQGAFYVFVDISKIEKNSQKFCQCLLEKEKVASIPGSAFMAEGFVRFSYTCSFEDIKEGIKRIRKFLSEEYKI